MFLQGHIEMQIAVFFTEDELLNEHTLLYRAESIKENEIQAVKDYASTLNFKYHIALLIILLTRLTSNSP